MGIGNPPPAEKQIACMCVSRSVANKFPMIKLESNFIIDSSHCPLHKGRQRSAQNKKETIPQK